MQTSQLLRRWVALCLLTFFLTINFVAIAPAKKSPNPTLAETPLIQAPIQLDGRILFHVAAAASSGESTKLLAPVQMRVESYEKKLNQIIRTGFNPQTLEIVAQDRGEQTIIIARDGKQLKEQKIAVITEMDARIHGLSLPDFVSELTTDIRLGLLQAQQRRQPTYLIRQSLVSGGIALLCFLITLFIAYFQKRLQNKFVRRCEKIEALPAQESLKNFNNESEIPANKQEQIGNLTEQKLSLEQKQNLNRLQRGILHIVQILIWLVALTIVSGFFPWTTWLNLWLITKWELVGTLLGIYLAIRVSTVLIDRLFKTWLDRLSLTPTPSQRRALRLVTFSRVLQGLIVYILGAIGIILALDHLDIPIAPLLAGAGIIGFAISFGSQNLIRDIINGSLILLEDQYAIGDFIDVGSASGLVEEMNLRITQLRGLNGRLSTIPNSNITTVHNVSKDWARIEFTFEISYNADLTKALSVISETAETMQKDPEWQEKIVDPVNLLGVNDLDHHGVQILMWIKTKPLQHWSVGREFRRRLKLAFDAENIAFGIPRQSLSWENYPPIFDGQK
ncbi:mechanosensitive ion channel family protein [Oscillatoria salina]|uniref:mechanosensitive ion channel family protein n=1 Tax=Oscillatoria salina TaxID=331517 RepID=UPI0013BAA1F9|nr:mechanosensitive ion channel family protein [Oscillatoria salina]MBZ8182965.1 mechanosensitive ion channel family protein [Oscillatoria salina IIICB1]NET86529.1 mechanosensitive ion channel family protein [Kamptonema sp. SIO1D9]